MQSWTSKRSPLLLHVLVVFPAGERPRGPQSAVFRFLGPFARRCALRVRGSVVGNRREERHTPAAGWLVLGPKKRQKAGGTTKTQKRQLIFRDVPETDRLRSAGDEGRDVLLPHASNPTTMRFTG